MRFSLRRALLPLQLLEWSQVHSHANIPVLRSLVLPCVMWATGFAQTSEDDVRAIQAEIQSVF